MQFCPECKALMKNRPGTDKAVCTKCGYIGGSHVLKSSEKLPEPKVQVGVVDEGDELISKTTQECPKCKHHEAYFWSKQTRAGDEGETSFFRCTKCKHTWRKYN